METQKITFDQLPEYVNGILTKVKAIEGLVETLVSQHTDQNKWMSLNDLVNYLPIKYSVSTIRRKVQTNQIPHYGNGKSIRFLKSEIDNWLRNGKGCDHNTIDTTINLTKKSQTSRWKDRHCKNDLKAKRNK